MDELHRIASLGRHFGLTPSVLSPDEITLPGLNTQGLIGALRVEEDANINPVDLCMAYAKLARRHGAKIHENTGIATLLVEGHRIKGVQLLDGREILADRVALCAGAWSKHLADEAGVPLPL